MQFSRMVVTRLETLHLRPRWLVVRVPTHAEIAGRGEATLAGRWDNPRFTHTDGSFAEG